MSVLSAIGRRTCGASVSCALRPTGVDALGTFPGLLLAACPRGPSRRHAEASPLTAASLAGSARAGRQFAAGAAASPWPKHVPSLPLRAARKANVGVLAASLKQRVADCGCCAVQAVGDHAVHNALKSIRFADKFLAEDKEAEPRRHVFTVRKHSVEDSYATREREHVAGSKPAGLQSDTVILEFAVRLSPTAGLPADHRTDPADYVRFATGTNVGRAAGLVAREVEQHGVATLSGMGQSVSIQVVKAIIIAETYLSKSKVLQEGSHLEATVRHETFTFDDLTSGREEKTRLVLTVAPAKQ